jgi:hypothetical protein
MADVNEVMHKIRAKLYPNYLPGGEGTHRAPIVSPVAETT